MYKTKEIKSGYTIKLTPKLINIFVKTIGLPNLLLEVNTRYENKRDRNRVYFKWE